MKNRRTDVKMGYEFKNLENCERMRCCELRRESAVACEDCVIKDACETRKRERPAPENKNALAELAGRLDYDIGLVDTCAGVMGFSDSVRRDIVEARRIVAELAKVRDCTFRGNLRVDQSADAVIACRAIAEEGVKDGEREP